MPEGTATMAAFITEAAEDDKIRLSDVGISQLRPYPSKASVSGYEAVRALSISLDIMACTPSVTPNTGSDLADHDSGVDMSPIAAIEQPADGGDDKQNTEKKCNELVSLHGD